MMTRTTMPRRAAARPGASATLALVGALALAGPASAWEMRVCADPNRMPFSNEALEGFDNRIARVLADQLGAELTFVWYPQVALMISDRLRVGDCDIIIGVPDGQANVTATLAYYRSPFVFTYRADRDFDVSMFDDPVLRTLKIGVQPSDGPTHEALVKRGLGDNIAAQYNYNLSQIIEDIANSVIDVGVSWGPAAGYYAAQQPVELIVAPVTPEFEPPFIPMFLNIVIGVRRGDESLRDRLDVALAEGWDEIQAILAEYHVPTYELARPILSIGGAGAPAGVPGGGYQPGPNAPPGAFGPAPGAPGGYQPGPNTPAGAFGPGGAP